MELFSFRPPPAPGLLAAPSHGRHHPALHAAARPPGPTADPPSTQAAARPSPYLSFPWPLLRLWPPQDEAEEPQAPPRRTRRGSWVMKILRVRSIWEGGRREEEEESEAVNGLLDEGDRCAGCGDGDDDGCCEIGDNGDGGSLEIDGDVFSRLLRRASLPEAEFYSLMSYLACLAYAIPKIKPAHLLKSYGLRLVTSSMERRSGSFSAENKEPQCTDVEEVETSQKAEESKPKEKGGGTQLNSSGVYGIVASAASYVHSQTKNILPLGRVGGDKGGTDSPEGGDVIARLGNAGSLEEASFVVASESVTAVVAAKDEVKQAVADDLSSSQSSPCEWFACDDDTSGTRYFVIQGSETLASWQANLLFEPIQFEGLDVLVHRGIYEAAKGIYQQMLPEIRAHLASRGDSAKLRFTGHSLGGSLSLLINLMLLTRGEAPASALLPVVTFGSPSVFCGGNALLEKLGLPRNHLQAVTLHRDIVPRAFSCTYPDRVAYILKAVNGNFRNHPCLKHQRLLYSPMGEILILQPEESFSPHHHLLPSGSGLYFLGHSSPDTGNSPRLLRAAFSAFLNNPHPLEILSDRSAYGADGTVMRDHDVGSYLGTVRAVIRAERKRARKARKEHSRLALWELFFPNIGGGGDSNPRRRGKISNALKGLGDSPNLQLLIMLLPARLLLLGALTSTSATFI